MYYVQECPTCGRQLEIRVAYIGRQVVCRHCRGQFVACDPRSPEYPPSDSGLGLLLRADELLKQVSDQLDSRNKANVPQADTRQASG